MRNGMIVLVTAVVVVAAAVASVLLFIGAEPPSTDAATGEAPEAPQDMIPPEAKRGLADTGPEQADDAEPIGVADTNGICIWSAPSSPTVLYYRGKELPPDKIEGLNDRQRTRLRKMLKGYNDLTDKEHLEIFRLIPERYHHGPGGPRLFQHGMPGDPFIYGGALILGEPEPEDRPEKQPEDSK